MLSFDNQNEERKSSFNFQSSSTPSIGKFKNKKSYFMKSKFENKLSLNSSISSPGSNNGNLKPKWLRLRKESKKRFSVNRKSWITNNELYKEAVREKE